MGVLRFGTAMVLTAVVVLVDGLASVSAEMADVAAVRHGPRQRRRPRVPRP